MEGKYNAGNSNLENGTVTWGRSSFVPGEFES